MVARISSGWLHRPRRPPPARIWPSAAPLSSGTAITIASGAVAQQRMKHVAVLCCRATGGHEVEPRRRAVFIRPPLTTRSTTGRVSAGIPRHTRPPRPRAAPPSLPGVAAPWGPPPSPHRPCVRRHRRIEAPLRLHLQAPLSALSFFSPCTWLTTLGKR